MTVATRTNSKKPAAAPAEEAEIAPIRLHRIERRILNVEIVGTAPLLAHRWSFKAKQEMLAKQQNRTVLKTAKDPESDFEESRYKFVDGSGDGFPVTGLKKSVVQGGGRLFGKQVRMTELRQHLHFLHDGYERDGLQLVRLSYPEGAPVMREDVVRLKGNTADLHYRALYPEWGAVLRIEYVPAVIDPESILALVDAGGANGIGEWRPEKDGSFGTYEVVGETV